MGPDEDLQKANQDSVDALTELRKEQENQKTNRYRAELAAKREAGYIAGQEKLATKHIVGRDQQGKDITLWDEVLKKADAAINSEQFAYNDFRSAMMALLNMFQGLNEAMSVSFEQMRGEYVINKVMPPIKEGLHTVKDYLLNKIKGEPKIDLPTLGHHVQFKEGKVVIPPLTAEGKVIEGEHSSRLNSSFKTLVGIWLLQNDYRKGPNDTYINVNDESIKLTQEKFQELNKGPASLAVFLEKASLTYKEDLDIEPKRGMSP